MATYDLPDWVGVASMEWGPRRAGVAFTGTYSGTRQALDFVADRWVASLTLKPYRQIDAGKVEGFFGLLTGGVHRVRLCHQARPVPVGTMRGTPTVAVSAVRGDPMIQVTTPGTIEAGDMFAAGNQLFCAAFDAAPAGGVAAVTLVNRVRAPIAAGSPVLWDRPTALFVLPAMSTLFTHVPALLRGLSVDLEEVWN